jgi:hypothetical protein
LVPKHKAEKGHHAQNAGKPAGAKRRANQNSQRKEKMSSYLGLTLSRKTLIGLLAAFSYGAVSVSITLFNKAVFSVYEFDLLITLTLSQVKKDIYIFQNKK